MNENITTTIELGARVPQLDSLPEDLFDCDPSQAFATFAALCCSANVKDGDNYLVDHRTLALRQLALFAAGAQVKFDSRDFRDLDDLAAKCANDSNFGLVSWVRRAAYDRAKSLGMAGPGRIATDSNSRVTGFAFIEPEDGRGYGELAADLAAELFSDIERTPLDEEAAGWEALRQRFTPDTTNGGVDAHTRKRLLTYAAVMAALKPRLCNTEVEAVVLLALYGAGSGIDLSAHQFDMLRMRAEYYISRMNADRYVNFRNREMAEFALEAARKRAVEADIIG
jgi:hypothetical protein